MMKTEINYRTPILLLFMLLIIGLRVLAPLSADFKYLAGFSGVGAVAIFGGSYFKNKVNAFLVPILVMFLSDLGLALTMGVDYGFYKGQYLTYIAFVLMILVGHLMIKKVNFVNVALAGFAAVFVHWIVSDLGVWYGSTRFPQTLMGFWQCLYEAIPYEKNFLYATWGYSALMFGIFEALKAKYPSLRERRFVHS